MLLIVTVAAAAGWLSLFGLLMAIPWKAPTRAGAASLPVDGQPPGSAEQPAVVSLLAGRLDAFGYPATLLDLAARGWLRLESQPGGPMMCVISADQPQEQLTAWERRVYDQVIARAGSRRDVPAAALSDGFAGPATLGTGEREMKSATESFITEFRREVIADSRQRGLSRKRLSEGAGCLLWLAAFGPAVAAGFALHAAGHHSYWIPVAGLVALCAVAGIATKGEKLTRRGRIALRRWRASRAEVGGTPLPSAAGSRAVTWLAPAGWPDRQVAYAAALGGAQAAVKLFSGPPGLPEGKTVWSSYTGSWRQITIGDAPPQGWRGAGGTTLSLIAVLLLALAPTTLAVAVVSSGAVREVALVVMVVDVVIVLRMLAKHTAIPRSAEFDGRVIEAWIDEETGENGTSYFPRIAIDDGQRDQAWVFAVSREQYATFTPGTHVHAWVNPRRNTLMEIRLIANR